MNKFQVKRDSVIKDTRRSKFLSSSFFLFSSSSSPFSPSFPSSSSSSSVTGSLPKSSQWCRKGPYIVLRRFTFEVLSSLEQTNVVVVDLLVYVSCSIRELCKSVNSLSLMIIVTVILSKDQWFRIFIAPSKSSKRWSIQCIDKRVDNICHRYLYRCVKHLVLLEK